MVGQGRSFGRIIVVRHHFLEYVEIAGFPDVCRSGQYQPQRVVVEIAPYLVVPLLVSGWYWWYAPPSSNWVAARSVSLSCPVGYLVDESRMSGWVPETYASSDAGFKVRRAPGHVEGDHALVLVPHVHHAVQIIIPAAEHISGQEPVQYCFSSSSLFRLLRAENRSIIFFAFFLLITFGVSHLSPGSFST